MRDMIHKIERSEIDIIGTQIVAKGHLRSRACGRRRWRSGAAHSRSARRRAHIQLLHQVTGRAAATHFVGKGLVQTHLPEHPVIQAIVA
jgi:primosomal protein N' (replication factor Y)